MAVHDSIDGTPTGMRSLARRSARAVRSLSTAAVVAITVGAICGGVGIASAATGGTFLLGRSNSESSQASLSDSRGTPLSLSAPKGKAPLAVNRSALVKHLNAQYVGGLSAPAIKPTGGDGFAGSEIALPTDIWTEVASTGKLAAGTYYVTGSALVQVESGDTGAVCKLNVNGDPNHVLQIGGATSPLVQAVETVGVKLPAGDTVQEWCSIVGTAGGSQARSAGITAIRVLSSSGTSATPTTGGGV